MSTITTKIKDIKDEFICPLSKEPMEDPVMIATSGITYERSMIEQWLENNQTCPITRKPSKISDLVPNILIRQLIENESKTNKKLKSFLDERKKERMENDKKFTWQWMLYEDEWVDFDSLFTQKRIEEAYKKKESIIPINAMYMIDFKNMIQIDIPTKSRYRPIRRQKGQLPSTSHIWYYRKYKKENHTSQYNLEEFAPMHPNDSERLEIEFKKEPSNRKHILVGPKKQFNVDISSMSQWNINYVERKREILRV